ncbi:unnamed protein product [Adineta steineri]|nr:unnamed protein product [Adineta steineri]CAF0767920.1 unnamed protein product [Adineta steineri]CAF0831063.1 unnamed protein product [Adineta steineri]CAF0871110.1 unnamed protein product [Adineta steineri]CAF3503523.1 unnamed protein product [Adineta steineri]
MVGNALTTLWLFAFMAIFCAFDAAVIKDRCPIPSQLKYNYDFNWKSRSSEWNNTNAQPASLQLVLSWTPTFCQSLPQSVQDKEFQCRNSQYFGIVVHGLWPQAAKASSVRAHPRNCRDEKQLNSTFIKRFYCMMPDEDLIQSQWEKHGTCYYKTATEYYENIEKLYQSLNIPDIAAMKSKTKTNVVNAFLTQNPKLLSSAIQVSMNAENQLKEIKICYTLNYQYVRCS